jgi:hypothetical protein
MVPGFQHSCGWRAAVADNFLQKQQKQQKQQKIQGARGGIEKAESRR